MFSVRRLKYAVLLFGLGLLVPLGAGCGSSQSGPAQMTEEQLKEEDARRKAIDEHFKDEIKNRPKASNESQTPAEAIRGKRQK